MRRSRKRVSYQVHTNMNGNIMCYLMNRKRTFESAIIIVAEVISTRQIDISKKKTVEFKAPDKRTPLMTKCEMYNAMNTS